jgi:hypothetical protein
MNSETLGRPCLFKETRNHLRNTTRQLNGIREAALAAPLLPATAIQANPSPVRPVSQNGGNGGYSKLRLLLGETRWEESWPILRKAGSTLSHRCIRKVQWRQVPWRSLCGPPRWGGPCP